MGIFDTSDLEKQLNKQEVHLKWMSPSIKKIVIAGGAMLFAVGAAPVLKDVFAQDAGNKDENMTETIDTNSVHVGTSYNAISEMDKRIENGITKNLDAGVYNIETEEQVVLEGQLGDIFDDIYSAYIFANANDYFSKDGMSLKTLNVLPSIIDAQDCIEDLGLYASKAGLPDNLVDLFSDNTDRNFMTKFKNSIDEYEKGNKEVFYQFLEDFENGIYSEASPFARMLMMNLATAHKSTFADKCWDKQINLGKTENGSRKRLDWWYWQSNKNCKNVSDLDKEISSLNTTCYTEMVQQLEEMKATLSVTSSSDKYSNISSYQAMKDSIVKKAIQDYAIGTEKNKAAHDAWYKLWKTVEELKKQVGITTSKIVTTGKSHVVSEKTTTVSDGKLKENARPSSGEHKEVTNKETGDKTLVKEDEYKGEKYTQDEITQRGYKDAINVVNRYIGGSDPKQNLANLKAHRNDYKLYLSSLDEKYHETYTKAFLEVMDESIENLEKAVNTIFIETEEPVSNDKGEIIKKETKDSSETISGPTGSTSDTEEEKEDNKDNNTSNSESKEEPTKPDVSTPGEPSIPSDANLIEVPGGSYEEIVEDEGEIIDKKEEDSEEQIIEAKTSTSEISTQSESKASALEQLKEMRAAVQQLQSSMSEEETNTKVL